MTKALDKARDEDRFVPWAYVFCDYSVSGLDASRMGYSSYKAVLRDPDHLIDTTYIDDFTRASRDEQEWWKLAAISKRLNKRLIGASDGFDLSNTNSDIMITVYAFARRVRRGRSPNWMNSASAACGSLPNTACVKLMKKGKRSV